MNNFVLEYGTMKGRFVPFILFGGKTPMNQKQINSLANMNMKTVCFIQMLMTC